MDDLSDKINQLLSDPESMEKIKALAGMLSGAGSPGAGSPGGNENNGLAPEKNGGDDDLNIDPEMIMKITRAVKLMNRDDPRVDLLLALKKNLSVSRQKRVDEAIRILRLLSLMPVLKEQNII